MDKGLIRPNAHRAEGTNGTPTENGLRESGAGNGGFAWRGPRNGVSKGRSRAPERRSGMRGKDIRLPQSRR